jgi:hypothetical protein
MIDDPEDPAVAAEAGARLALQILTDFFAEQIAAGAVETEGVMRLLETAADRASTAAFRLEPAIRAHLERMQLALHEAAPPQWDD